MPDWVQGILFAFSRLNVASIVDIVLVGAIIYGVLMLIRGTVAEKMLLGIAVLLVLGAVLSTTLNLTVLSWLLRNASPYLVFGLLYIFQPELRRALEQVGRASSIIPHAGQAVGSARTIEAVSVAATRLSERRWGGLMVLEKDTGLNEFVQTGVTLDSLVGVELLLTIFFPNSPLHDGAVIIRGDRVVAAGSLLPLAESAGAGHTLGTRHRAALGITEQTDAVVVVVSEETGQISLAHNGRMVRNLDESKLRKVLGIIYKPSGRDGPFPPFSWFKGRPLSRSAA